MIGASDPESFLACNAIAQANANINHVSDHGQCALSEAVKSDFSKLAEVLLKKGAKIFFEKESLRDISPFFKAITYNKVWAIEMFCDHGADVNTLTTKGQHPLNFAIDNYKDDICMYLSLRTDDNDQEDIENGQTPLMHYISQKDLHKSKQLLMRGADVNYVSRKSGMTPLLFAIENQLPSKIIRFLLKSGANPHQEDKKGQDC